EDQADLDIRIINAVNDGFAGTIDMAYLSAQNAKRARELQKTMDALQKRLQSVTEPFKGLSREQMTLILMMDQRFKQQIQEKVKQLRIDREKKRQTRSRVMVVLVRLF
ncbi:plasmid recombination enzyme, partial [Escherichia coli]|nr:plasmid recombination enzyme [Escherichia coli]